MRLPPRLLVSLVLLTLLPTPAARADRRVVREFKAADFEPAFVAGPATRPAGGVSRTRAGDAAVVDAVEPPAADVVHTVTVLSLDHPGVTQTRYFVLGDVEYAGVEGTGYLELWNDFPGGGHYFSRTMGDSGPMKVISGTSAKRPFLLPFNAEPGMVPTKLTLNVVLPGKGKVTLSRVRLVENGPAASQPATAPASNAAFPESRLYVPTDAEADAIASTELAKFGLPALIDERDHVAIDLPGQEKAFGADHPMVRRLRALLAGFDRRIVALGGPALTGSLATRPAAEDARAAATGPKLTGPLAWANTHFAAIFMVSVGLCLAAAVPLRWLIQRGRGRAIVFGVFALMLAGGVAQLFAAGVAFGMNKSADAWATLLGCSAILIVIPAMTLRQVRRQYDDLELRKLRALDVG